MGGALRRSLIECVSRATSFIVELTFHLSSTKDGRVGARGCVRGVINSTGP